MRETNYKQRFLLKCSSAELYSSGKEKGFHFLFWNPANYSEGIMEEQQKIIILSLNSRPTEPRRKRTTKGKLTIILNGKTYHFFTTWWSVYSIYTNHITAAKRLHTGLWITTNLSNLSAILNFAHHWLCAHRLSADVSRAQWGPHCVSKCLSNVTLLTVRELLQGTCH